ncbi:amino acid adenylation domain-containing protein [Streptomyces sp. NPDC002659]|uniref:amino acid adenylation domain-containing protein n=1 Tax=Streptomyces sp. NPDC002659 TaxID=3364656 RepID=UPI0036BEBAAB
MIQLANSPQHAWNETRAPYHRDLCIHQLFESVVKRQENAVAVRGEDRQLSYGQLNALANGVARDLLERGVSRGDRVGVLGGRSVEAVAAMLGVLKAGGVYVPLDPDYPDTRLMYMAEAVDIRHVVAWEEEAYRSLWPDPVVIGSSVGVSSVGNLQVEISATDAAYVMFTSGTSGRPKGVAIPHRGVTRLAADKDFLPVLPGDRLTHGATLGFDASVLEIWCGLLSGAELCLLDRDTLLDSGRFQDFVQTERPTVVFLPTAVFHHVGSHHPAAFRGVRDLVVGGESLNLEVARKVLAEEDAPRLLNAYGPTENSVVSSFHEINETDLTCKAVPIGRPVRNSTCYVLLEDGSPAAPGEVGELCVGGDGVALGYVNDAALTAEKFPADPYGDDPAARMYRTGDLASWRADGVLEFHGRQDRQVKIRGFRVELAAIERELAGHPCVADAAAVVHRFGETKRIVAYATRHASARASETELSDYLRQRLPLHEVPAALVMVERLPLTLNGKIDYGALPDPFTPPMQECAEPPEPPARAKTLVQACRDVLGRADVDWEAGFLALGGDSLSAARLAARLPEVCGRSVTVSRILAAGSLRELGNEMERETYDWDEGPQEVEVALGSAGALASYGQEGIWRACRLNGATSFNEVVGLRITGPLRADVLESCLQEVVARHDALRMTLEASPGGPLQTKVRPSLQILLDRLDYSFLPRWCRWSRASEKAGEFAREPFDLETGPLIRASLSTLEEEDHLLTLVMHHTISDGLSFALVIDELSALYAAAVSGTARPGLPAPVPYERYAARQRARAASGNYENSLVFWERHLAGAPPRLDLPRRRGGPTGQEGGIVSASLGREVSEELRRVARHSGVTPFMLLFAAWNVLLGRLADTQNAVVGTVAGGRSHADETCSVGYFANLLPLRVDLSGEPSFEELVQRVRAILLEAYTHQEVPFELVLERLTTRRDADNRGLVQVVVVSDDGIPRHSPFGEAIGSVVCVDPGTAKFDLRIGLSTTGDEVGMEVQYRTELFDREDLERWLAALQRLLQEALRRPQTPITALPAMSEADQQRMLAQWGAEPFDFPQGVCIQDLIANQARRLPHAVAVELGDWRWSYAEVSDRADRAAARLRAAGVKPGDPVAVCASRSPSLVAVVLGVLKAGGVYVPLDARGPAPRLVSILEESAITLLVSDRDAVLVESPGVQRLDLDRIVEDAGEPDQELPPLDVAVKPSDLAYIVHTSGSTGRPKGVAVEHGSVVNIATYLANAVGLTERDRCAAVNPPSFDLGIYDLLGPLMVGARIVLSPAHEPANAAGLAERLRTGQVTFMLATPLAWRLLLATGWRPQDGFTAISSGEVLPRDLAKKLLSCGLTLWNAYGPAETTIWSTLHQVTAADAEGDIPVGRPAGNTAVYVLDGHGQPVPQGVVGELYIGGVGVSRGYVNRPDITAARYLPDPYTPGWGGRMYRTGDLARWRGDGLLELLGRMDSQVKVHGYRVECGEIEACLRAHPGISDAVVLFDGEEERQLVGYYVPAAPHLPDLLEAMRSHLAYALPWYMVPARLIAVPHIPQSPNGKADRTALRSAAAALRTSTRQVDHADSVAARLRAIWQAVLGQDPIADDVNVFELGGTSLHLAEIHARTVEEFGLGEEVTLFDLFRYPTLRAYGEHIRRHLPIPSSTQPAGKPNQGATYEGV